MSIFLVYTEYKSMISTVETNLPNHVSSPDVPS